MGKTLEKVIIVVLIIVILYMLFKKERMDNITPVQTSPELNNFTQPTVSMPAPVEAPAAPAPVAPAPVPVPVAPVAPAPIPVEAPTAPAPTVNETGYDKLNTIISGTQKTEFEEVDKFIKEYKDYSRFNKPIPTISTDEEINAYRSSFLDFRMYTDQTSHHMDPVDQMNLENIAKKNSAGLAVSDVYDRISATNYKPSNIDIVGMQHNEKRNDRVVSNQFTYENDSVNNGGFFFGQIMGSDVDNETYMPF